MGEAVMKTRGFRSRTKSHAVPHPDGGVWYLWVGDATAAQRLQDRIFAAEHEVDALGAPVLDEKGAPVLRKVANEESVKLIVAAVRETCVDRVEGIVDADTGDPLASTPELIEWLLAEFSDRPVEVEVPVFTRDAAGEIVVAHLADGVTTKTEKKTMPAREQYSKWVVSQFMSLAISGKQAAEAQAKN